MTFVKGFVFVLMCVSAAFAQEIIPGPCPPQDVVDPFNVTLYLGTWYEIQAYEQVASIGSICVTATYSEGDNDTIKVYNTQFSENGEFSSYNGTAEQVEDTAAKLNVTFGAGGITPGEAPYWVLDTDYSNYAVVWSCRENGSDSLQTAYFLSRVRDPSTQIREKVEEFMVSREINTTLLSDTRQNDCPTSAASFTSFSFIAGLTAILCQLLRL